MFPNSSSLKYSTVPVIYLSFLLFNTDTLLEVNKCVVSDSVLSPGILPTSVIFLIIPFINRRSLIFSFLFGVKKIMLEPVRLDNLEP